MNVAQAVAQVETVAIWVREAAGRAHERGDVGSTELLHDLGDAADDLTAMVRELRVPLTAHG